ncbi:MAG: AAA family ATPase, partial [Chlorobiaceae bacterium]|nr:AAA family ATPase [Chlorobiaceae bacterium]
MKILKLRFANLNSLQGEWEIDFTRPEYVSDGLFAITGPTGSGKSTILDAICLALYGQTPRLGRITKSSNEIMSRQAGDCFAEVSFVTASGLYRCHWSQHRSRHRRGGELQTQKHEISDATTGKVIQSKLQETLQEVEGRTGMDYDRFTRSMLLAQGSFAKFLQADADERSPVLEQITGTELYSLISMKVHERRRSEHEQLDRLELECEGIRLLGEEELKALDEERTACLAEESGQHTALEGDLAALHWLQEIARLHEALASIGREAVSLEAEREAFSADEERLRLARHASSVEPLHAVLMVSRNEWRRTAEEFSVKVKQRPEAIAALQQAESEYLVAESHLFSAQESADRSRPIMVQVRQFDLRISDRLREAELKRQELDVLDQRDQELLVERAGVADAVRKARETLQELRHWQLDRQVDATLPGALPGIRQSLEALRPASERAQDTEKRIETARVDLEASRQEMHGVGFQAKAAQEAFDKACRLLDTLKATFTSELGASTLKSLRLELDALKERRRLLEEIAALYISGKELAPKIDDIDSALQEVERKREETTLRLDYSLQILEHSEREALLQEERAMFALRVRSLEEERSHLVEGKPCPLCGSASHPYGEGHHPLAEADAQTLAEARRSVQQAAQHLRDLEILQAGYGKEIEQMRQRRHDLALMREESGRKCLTLLGKVGVQSAARQAEPEVIVALQETVVSVSVLAERIERLESDETRIRDDEATLMQRQEAAYTAQRRLEQSGEQLRAREGALTHLCREFDAVRREHDERKELFLGLLTPYALAAIDVEDTEGVVMLLEERNKLWLDAGERCSRIEQDLVAGDAALQNIDTRLQALGSERSSKREGAETLTAEIGAARTERMALFQDKDPDEEERRLENLLISLREKLSHSGDARSAARQVLAVLDTSIEDLQRAMQERRAELDHHEEAFAEILLQKGFADEPAWLDARLDEAGRRSIEERSEALRKSQADLQARHDDRQERLDAELERRLTMATAEELASGIEQRQQALRDIRGRIGAITSQLEASENSAAEHRLKIKAVEAQQIECRRWEKLHDLIGSADGKKFRNFAQGITFEIMIAQANRQLVRMTDRYVLLHDPAGPLELSVIDQWQAGEVRSTRNLSGGESFIVSLALALGLSQMSSRNVRVDSLFLDEGFGTLDEESLETALKT